MSTCETDVLIIGGGPGGTAAAITCAQAGRRVTLIEQADFPRVAPGETLHPGIEPLLQRLGVWEAVLAAGFLRHTGHWVQWDGPPHFAAFGADASGSWQGFQAWRARFDELLLQRALAVGCTVVQPCRALRPLVEAARVVGLQTTCGEFTARFVIDAGGRSHWLARQLSLPIQHYSRRLFARYGYVTGTGQSRYEAPCLTLDEEGWTWTAQVQPTIYQWTRMLFASRVPAAAWVPAEFQHLSPLSPSQGADVTWRKVEPLAGPGYFLIGDAAAVLDPTASHGVLRAIMSGMMAGHSISQLETSAPATARHAVAQQYNQWLSDWFLHDVTKLKELYTPLRQRPWHTRANAL